MFDEYRVRMSHRGETVRDANRQQSIQIMENGFDYSQTYKQVMINDEFVDARITSGSSTTVRGGMGNYEIMFRDGVYYPAGTYVFVKNAKDEYEPWIIMYISDDHMFPRHILRKCNYLLRWKNAAGDVVERWVVFSDNQRLINGERNVDWNKLILSSYSTVLFLPCDEETINIKMDQRFLIDHPDIEGNPEAWIVRNRNVNSKIFGGYDGIVELAISRHQFNHNTDNKEEMIADYNRDYTHPEEFTPDVNYDVRITYNGKSDLKMDTPFKTYKAEFQVDGEPDDSIEATWVVLMDEKLEDAVTYEILGNVLKIKCSFDSLFMGKSIRLIAANEELGISAELPVKVVSAI